MKDLFDLVWFHVYLSYSIHFHSSLIRFKLIESTKQSFFFNIEFDQKTFFLVECTPICFHSQTSTRQQTSGSETRRLPRSPPASIQGKTNSDCTATSSASCSRKSRSGRNTSSSGIGRTREAGTFANRPANVHRDDIVRSGTTRCSGDRALTSHACIRSINDTGCSRWSRLPYCTKQRRQHHEQRQKPHPLVSGTATTKTWSWRHQTTSFSTPSNEAQKAMRRKCFVRSDVASDQNNV